MPDSPNLSSALGETVDHGRQFLARVESLAESLSAELAQHEEAGRRWAGERQAIHAEAEKLRADVESLSATLVDLRRTVHRAEQERDQVAADRDQARQAREATERELGGAQAELAASTADLARLRDQLTLVTKDRDGLQADQIKWGLDREQLLVEQARMQDRVADVDRNLAAQRAEYEALVERHAELTEQSNRLAADWVTRRHALATEIQSQNEEMDQVRKLLQESQERERHVIGLPQAGAAAGAPSAEQTHLINSRLNVLVGFSSVLLDERTHQLSVEDRREYLKYLHDSAVKLTETVRAVTGAHTSPDEDPIVVDRDRRPPDILVADNDPVSRQRIEPFLKRAGYEVIYVDNGPRALEKASTLQPLAILIDGQLPPSGAPALVRELRKDPRTRETPLVLLVAPDAPPVTIVDCEVLVKPIDRQQLVQLMVRFDLMADGKLAKKMPANLLVIDDDAQAVSLVKAILKPYNVRVSSVDNARAGIEQALRNKPDIVILDLVMPGVDGFEVIAALRRDKDMSRVPILVHTAKTLTAEDRQRLQGKVESIVEKAEFQPERFLELLLKRGERRKRAA